MSRKQKTVVKFELDTNGTVRKGGSRPREPIESCLKSSALVSIPRVGSGASRAPVERPRSRASPAASKSEISREGKHASLKKQSSGEAKRASPRNWTSDEATKHVSTKSILLTRTIPSVPVKQVKQKNGSSCSTSCPVPSPRHVSTKYVLLKPSLRPQEAAVSMSSSSVSSQRHVSSTSASFEPPKPSKRSFQDITPRYISPPRLEYPRQVSLVDMVPKGTPQRHVSTKAIQTQSQPTQPQNGHVSQPQPAMQVWNRRISQQKSASPARHTQRTHSSTPTGTSLPRATTQPMNGRLSRQKSSSPARQTQQPQASPRTAAPRRASLPSQNAGHGAVTGGGWSGAMTDPTHKHGSKESRPKPHSRASRPAKHNPNYQRISDSPLRKNISKNLVISEAYVPPPRSASAGRGSPERGTSASTAPASLLSPGLVSRVMKPAPPRHNKASRLRCSFHTIKVAFTYK